MRHNKRALSPIIATILLIVITIAAALIIWSMLGTFGRTSASSGVSIVTASAELQPDGRTLVLKIAVKNTGTTLLKGNVTASVGNTTYYLLTTGSAITTTPAAGQIITFPAGQTIELTTSVPVTSAPSSVTFTAKFADPSGKIVQDIKGVSVVQGG
jgi:flagellin-like protein